MVQAQPSAKGPTKTVSVNCSGCRRAAAPLLAGEPVILRHTGYARRAFLYKYRKGGKGALVKCFVVRSLGRLVLQRARALTAASHRSASARTPRAASSSVTRRACDAVAAACQHDGSC